MRFIALTFLVLNLVFLGTPGAFSAGIGYFSESVSLLQENVQMANRAQTLEDIQAHARKIMALAEDFQEQAQSVNDQGFVNEAIDIYNSAYRALQSSTLEEARSYAREIFSHTEIVSEQSGMSLHTPYSEQERQKEDLGEDGSLYGQNMQ